jgi:transposase
VHSRFRRWTREGLWDRILTRSSASWTPPGRSTGGCGASTARTSGRTASPRARGENRPELVRLGEPADHALGRSRGGFTTKLHLVTDGTGLPLAVALSAGQAHESRYATPLLDSVRVPRHAPGRPRRGPRPSPATRATATRRSAPGCGASACAP